MATRMQQRRGTAQQWTTADPILAAGEIGFETDTNQFKMGDGVNLWSALSYFKNLEDLGGSLDDYVPVALVGEPEGIATLNASGHIPISQLGSLITNAPGVLDTLGEIAEFVTAVDTAVDTHEAKTLNVHGIADTAQLETLSGSTSKASAAQAAAELTAGNALTAHNNDSTDVHGIADTSVLATQTNISTAITAHNDDTTGVHGIADTAALATTAATSSAIGTAVSDHTAVTANVHGIADTAALATKTYADSAVTTAVAALTKSSVGLANVDNTTDANKPVSTATQTALDLKAPLADPTFTGTVSGVTKTHVGLGNVDNTADADKPVSSATQTALNLKANLANPTFTGTVTSTGALVVEGNLTVSGTTTTVNAADLSITDPLIYLASNQYDADLLDVGFMAATGAPGGTEASHLHSGFFRDASDSKKWKLVSNVPHPVGNVVDVTNATRETLVVGALEATTVNASSGIVFSDGTQTKLGVPSVTTFATAISSSATLAAGEADKFVPLTGAVTITLPATGYSTGQSIDFYQASGTGAQFSDANSTVGTPGLKFRTTNSVVTAMKTPSGWLVFGDLSL
jgi:hypothetical protein